MSYSAPRSRRVLRVVGLASFTASLVWAIAAARAGEITNLTWYPGVASVGAEPIVPPVDPNNDNVSGPSPNGIFIPQKSYVGIGPVDIVLDVSDSGETNEYMFVEGVSNGTGLNWNGYRIELGFGVGAGFSTSPSGDGLDFDAPDFDSPVDFSVFFPTWVVNEDDITASGGIMPNGAYSLPYFRFHVDVPDGITSFTIRQIPIGVPEPSGWILACLGVAVASQWLVVSGRGVGGGLRL